MERAGSWRRRKVWAEGNVRRDGMRHDGCRLCFIRVLLTWLGRICSWLTAGYPSVWNPPGEAFRFGGRVSWGVESECAAGTQPGDLHSAKRVSLCEGHSARCDTLLWLYAAIHCRLFRTRRSTQTRRGLGTWEDRSRRREDGECHLAGNLFHIYYHSSTHLFTHTPPILTAHTGFGHFISDHLGSI